MKMPTTVDIFIFTEKFSCSAMFIKKEFGITRNMRFIHRANCMLGWLKYEKKSFITSWPERDVIQRHRKFWDILRLGYSVTEGNYEAYMSLVVLVFWDLSEINLKHFLLWNIKKNKCYHTYNNLLTGEVILKGFWLSFCLLVLVRHYGNTAIQIYWKFYDQQRKIFW